MRSVLGRRQTSRMSDARDALVRTARRGELHHALILHGPADDLLESIAQDIARALNCIREEDPEGECAACSRIRRGIHPDVHDVRLESNRKMISIEQIRNAIGEASLKPYEGRTKVFIVNPADAMSTQAANSLLKTLEEPYGNTVFMLLTRSSDRMLPTIRSRAQSIPVRPQMSSPETLAEDEISLQEARLRAEAADDEEGAERSSFARETLTLLGQIAEGDSLGIVELSQRIASFDDPARGARLVAQILRDLAGASPDDAISPADARVVSERIAPETLLGVARGLLDRAEWGRVNPDARMQFEGPLLDLML